MGRNTSQTSPEETFPRIETEGNDIEEQQSFVSIDQYNRPLQVSSTNVTSTLNNSLETHAVSSSNSTGEDDQQYIMFKHD